MTKKTSQQRIYSHMENTYVVTNNTHFGRIETNMTAMRSNVVVVPEVMTQVNQFWSDS